MPTGTHTSFSFLSLDYFVGTSPGSIFMFPGRHRKIVILTKHNLLNVILINRFCAFSPKVYSYQFSTYWQNDDCFDYFYRITNVRQI